MGDEMAGTVWVGRVKSGVNPETLEPLGQKAELSECGERFSTWICEGH